MNTNDSQRLRELLTSQGMIDARERAMKNVAPFVEELQKNECAFEVIHDDNEIQKSIEWIEKHFPMHAGGAIRWEEVAGAIVSENPSNLEEVTKGQNIPGEQEVTVCFFLSDYPVIRCSYSSFEVAYSAMMQLHCEDWWCFDPSDSWCIERYHEGTLSFGISTK